MGIALLDLIKQKAQQAVDYFNPSSNAGNNFWSTPVAQGMATFQETNPLKTGFDILGGVAKQYGSEVNKAGGQNWQGNPQTTFTPTTVGEKGGTDIEKLITDLVVMQNSGFNQPLEQMSKMTPVVNNIVARVPRIGPAVTGAEDWVANMAGKAGKTATDWFTKLGNTEIKAPELTNRPGFIKTPFLKETINNGIVSSQSQEEAAAKVTQFADTIVKNFSGDDLKASRAALQQQLEEVAGKTGNWKGDYANLQMQRDNPDVSSLIKSLEDGIAKIDEKLNTPPIVPPVMENLKQEMPILPPEVTQPGPPALDTQNAPLKTTERFFKPAGSKQADFVADANGELKPVTEMGPKKTADFFKTQETPTEVKPGVGGALPSGPETQVPQGLPGPSFETKNTDVIASELNAGAEQVTKTADTLKKSLLPTKGGAKKVGEYLVGPTNLEGSLGIIKNEGPAGRAIYDTVKTVEEKSALLEGQFNDRLRVAMKPLTKEELTTFSDVVEGKAMPLSVNQQNAVDVWRRIATEVHDLATKTGMKIGKIESYWPHFVKQGDKTALDEGFFMDRGAGVNYGNLVKSRLQGAVPYSKEPNVLFDYINHAVDNIVRRSYYGESDRNLYNLAAKTADSAQVSSLVDTILGKNTGHGIADTISRGIRSVETFKINFTSPFTNLTQNLSTEMRTDLPNAIKTMKNIINNPEQAISRTIRAGEIEPAAGNKLLTRMGELGDVSIGKKWLELIRFNLSERTNRIFAVNAGYEYATKLLGQAKSGSQAAIRELDRLGIKDLANITEEDLIKAGRNVSQATQFAVGPGELPQGWSTPVGKVMTQFKSFAYKQSGFIKDTAVRSTQEAMKGNFKPLITALTGFGVGAPIMGEIVSDIRSLVTNNKRTSTGVQRYIEDVLAGSSFGLLDNLGGLTGQYGESGVVSAIAGPFAGDVVKAGTAVADTSKGLTNYDTGKSFMENVDPNRTTSRFVLGNIPGVGKAISNTVVPNSYVENYAGPNNGLSENAKPVYNALKENDQAKAEAYKQSQQAQRDTGSKNIFQAMFSKKGGTFSSVPTDPAAKKKQKTDLGYYMENGGDLTTVDPSVTVTHLFDGKTYDTASRSEKGKILSTMKSLLDSGKYTEAQTTQMAQAVKLTSEDINYYLMAKMPEADRLEGVLSFMNSNQMSRDELMAALALNKRTVGGSAVAGTSTFDYLYNQGLISKDEKNLLNNVKFDEVLGKFYMDRDYTGGGMTTAQRKALITKVNTIYKRPAAKKPTALPAKPKTPTLNLSMKRTGGKSSSQWFQNY